MTVSRKPILVLIASLVLSACGAAVITGAGEDLGADGTQQAGAPAGAGAAPDRPGPNVIVVMTDDQAPGTMAAGMPETASWLASEGASFSQAIVTTPLCCPSRAAFLTGQYGHNNGVLRNVPGYPDLDQPGNVLPVWMQAAGYRTAMVGKFLNGYAEPRHRDAVQPAPGWDVWRPLIRQYSYSDFRIGIDGRLRHHGRSPRDYLTRVLTRQAGKVIDGRDDRPTFLWLSHFAPHPELGGGSGDDGRCARSAIPAPNDRVLLESIGVPRPRSFAERDVRDKPSFIRAQRRPGKRARGGIADAYRCQIAALRSVDRSVSRLRERVEQAGMAEETVWIFTSDNGFMFGEHRIRNGKGAPYEESIRVPLAVVLPDALGDTGGVVDEPVANIDLAPTILDLAGAVPCEAAADKVCRTLDGRSLLPLLAGERTGFEDRAIVIESDDGRPCAFRGLRTSTHTYIESGGAGDRNGRGDDCRFTQRELYDLDEDPFQVENLAAGPVTAPVAAQIRDLAIRLERLRACAGSRSMGGDPSRVCD